MHFQEPVGLCVNLKPFVLKKERITIGKGENVDYPLDSPDIDEIHAVISKPFPNNWVITDNSTLGGKNGVYINDSKIVRGMKYALKEDYVVSLGNPDSDEFKFIFTKEKSKTELPNLISQLHDTMAMWQNRVKKTNKSAGPHLVERQQTIEDARVVSSERLSDSDDDENYETIMPRSARLDRYKTAVKGILFNVAELKDLEQDLNKMQSIESEMSNKDRQMETLRQIQRDLVTETINLNRKLEKESKAHSEAVAKLTKVEEEKNSLELLLEHQQAERQFSLLRHHGSSKLLQDSASEDKARLLEALDSLKEKETELTSLYKIVENQTLVDTSSSTKFIKLMEEEIICAICTEIFREAVTLGCNHTFCNACISGWKTKKNKCPQCWADIEREVRTPVLDKLIEKMKEV